ncbi:MAG TPA: NAD-dependent epimerase/dehydratase family protein [Vicinamibacterales bacterium]
MPGPLSGKLVAVTGAAGFIGARLAGRLAQDQCTLLRVFRSNAPPIVDAVARVIDLSGDVGDRAICDRLVEADVIFHLAAQTSVAEAAARPDRDLDANVTPMRQLLAACRERTRRPTVLFAGTVTEAGVPARLPVNEDALDDPITVYDRHKLIAERELKTAARRGEVFGATLRLCNVYGPGAHGRRADRDVLNRMISAAMIGQPLTIYGDGGQIRDYVFVDDVVDAFLLAAAHAGRVNANHFVIGSGRGTTIRAAFECVAARAERATGRPVRVTSVAPPMPLGDIERRNCIADHTRFTAATGWRPSVDLSEGIDRTIEALACV